MHQKLGKYFKVMWSVFTNLVPHIHHQHLVIKIYQLLTYFVKFRQEFKAFVINQVREDKAIVVFLLCRNLCEFTLFWLKYYIVRVWCSSQVQIPREEISDDIQNFQKHLGRNHIFAFVLSCCRYLTTL